MSFEKDYDKIANFTKGLYYKQGASENTEPDEIIAEVYIKLFNNKQDYSFELFKKAISNYFLELRNGSNENVSFGSDWSNVNNRFKDEKCCKDCNEIFPSAYFYILTTKTGKKTQVNFCKKCITKRVLKSAKKNVDYLQLNKERFKKHVDSNRKGWNAYLRERFVYDKENLTDNYIKKLLRKWHPIEYILAHPKLIIEKREALQQKRERKNKKAA